jgi:hypothetical protein
MDVESVRKHKMGIKCIQLLSRSLGNTELTQNVRTLRRGDLSQKVQSLIRTAECSWPLQVIIGVESVWKHETGLGCNQRLLRKLKIKVATAVGTWHRTGCSVLQFSLQPGTDPF